MASRSRRHQETLARGPRGRFGGGAFSHGWAWEERNQQGTTATLHARSAWISVPRTIDIRPSHIATVSPLSALSLDCLVLSVGANMCALLRYNDVKGSTLNLWDCLAQTRVHGASTRSNTLQLVRNRPPNLVCAHSGPNLTELGPSSGGIAMFGRSWANTAQLCPNSE